MKRLGSDSGPSRWKFHKDLDSQIVIEVGWGGPFRGRYEGPS